MVKVFPFKGITYNKKKISKLDKVMAPPYDVISSEEQDTLYNQHEFNVIKLILGKDFPEDTKYNNKYVRAANFFDGLLRHDILIRDEKPCIYIYEQSFKANNKNYSRIGFIALLRLEDLGKGKVFPHEETFPKAKVDRLNLMLHTKAHFESIFTLFHDPKNKFIKIMKPFKRKKAYIDIKDKNKVVHKIWKIDRKSAIHRIMKEMKDKWIFIADGHHRYEASLKVKDTLKEQTQKFHDDEGYNHVMMFFTPIESKGLAILPIQRVIKVDTTLFDPTLFTQELSEQFEVTEIPFNKKTEAKTKKKLFKLIEERGKHTFGMYLGGEKYYIIKLKNEHFIDELVPENKPRQWKHLDVTILQTLVFDKILHIKKNSKESEQNILYIKNNEVAFDKVKSGEYQIAFFLNATSIDDVIHIASKYEKMPQKSTFFYPKLMSGLVMNKIELEEKVEY